VSDDSDPTAVTEPEGEPPKAWRRKQRDIANILWVSFLTASAATMIFFASVDPDVLSGNNTLGWEISRQSGYALGFFGFWALTALTGFLCVLLVRTERRARDFPAYRDEKDHSGKPGSGGGTHQGDS
jgi:hypothetical protein